MDGSEDPAVDEDLAELVDELEEAEETVDSPRKRRAVRRAIGAIGRVANGRVFGVDDLAQQIVGGVVLSAPFVVTEEVWALAGGMDWIRTTITVCMMFAIGYATLYRAEDRDTEIEEDVAGIPQRFVSLIVVSYGSVVLLALVFDAPATFGADVAVTVKAVCIGSIFSVVGAATADSLF
jgi:uncharacterized membrane protein